MNKKVWTAMLVLTVVFLCFLYVSKIFFPQEFVMCIENERLIQIGSFIDNHKWAYYLFGTCTSFATYWLYCCASCHKKKLTLKENGVILLVIIGSIVLSLINNEMVSLYGVLSMLLLPLLFKGNAKSTIIVYCTHYTAQWLTLKIRDLPTYVQYYNMLFATFLTFEMYLWLVLFYIVFNYKEKEE